MTRLSVEKLAESLSVGEETLADILAGLTQPGRDMRDEMPAPLLRTDVLSMEDLKPGMELTERSVMSLTSAHLLISV